MGEDVFTHLVDRYYAALYRFALSLARSQADACDLTQQTFYVWATKGHTLRDTAKAKTWLFTTLYREFLRGRRRDTRLTSLEELPPGENDIADDEIDRLRQLDGTLVLEALGAVAEVFRAPLTLFYLEDLSYQEIAETLGVPVGTVMSRLSRGKDQLRAALAAQAQGPQIVPFPAAQRRQSP
ncbi:MAG TPA: RNA polymerase sigma factor [Opitutaceae bacterium]|nr:RNA polymerase sigma factor [Opitutaceae bacterium]